MISDSWIGDHVWLALAALVLGGALGSRSIINLFSPITRIPTQIVRSLERKLNREIRTPKEKQVRGGIVVVVACALALAAGFTLAQTMSGWHYSGLVEIILLILLLPARAVADFALNIQKHLNDHEVATARMQLEGTVWRNHALLDEHGLARAAIETLIVDFAEKVISPLCWYILMGLPGLFLSRTIRLLYETIGTNREGFGLMAYFGNLSLHYFPVRFAALVFALTAFFVPFGKPIKAITDFVKHLLDEKSERLLIATIASALGITLGGPLSVYAGGSTWLGNGTAQIGAKEIGRALVLYVLAYFMLLLALALWLPRG